MAEQPRKYSIEDYMTAPRAEEAVKMYLVLPDGTRSDDYLLVVGTESKDFRRARNAAEQRAAIIASLKTDEEKMDAVDDARYTVLAACVKGWSFEVKFTQEAAKALIAGSPYIAEALDSFISRRANFFGKPSKDSTTTRKRKHS